MSRINSQPMSNGGEGPIISVNSWGYSTSPGMAGPFLDGNSAACLFDEAQVTPFNAVSNADGSQGVDIDC